MRIFVQAIMLACLALTSRAAEAQNFFSSYEEPVVWSPGLRAHTLHIPLITKHELPPGLGTMPSFSLSATLTRIEGPPTPYAAFGIVQTLSNPPVPSAVHVLQFAFGLRVSDSISRIDINPSIDFRSYMPNGLYTKISFCLPIGSTCRR